MSHYLRNYSRPCGFVELFLFFSTHYDVSIIMTISRLLLKLDDIRNDLPIILVNTMTLHLIIAILAVLMLLDFYGTDTLTLICVEIVLRD